MGVLFLCGLVECFLIGTYCLADWQASWIKALPREPFWQAVACSYDADGDAPVKNTCMHVKDLARAGGAMAIKLETTANAPAKLEVMEDVCVAFKDQERGGGGWCGGRRDSCYL
jgi:hypothetical protein